MSQTAERRASAYPYRAFHAEVLRLVRLSPSFLRVTFTGSDLDALADRGFDQRIKLILPLPDVGLAQWPRWASTAAQSPSWATGGWDEVRSASQAAGLPVAPRCGGSPGDGVNASHAKPPMVTPKHARRHHEQPDSVHVASVGLIEPAVRVQPPLSLVIRSPLVALSTPLSRWRSGSTGIRPRAPGLDK